MQVREALLDTRAQGVAVADEEQWRRTQAAVRQRKARFGGLEPELMSQVLFLDRFIRILIGASGVLLVLGVGGLALLGTSEDPVDSQDLSLAVAFTALGLSAAIGGLNLYAQRLAAMRELLKYWDAHPESGLEAES